MPTNSLIWKAYLLNLNSSDTKELQYGIKVAMVVYSVKVITDDSSGCFICIISFIALSLIMYQKLAKGYTVVYSEN